VFASHNYVSRQTTEFFRAITPYGGGDSGTGIAVKPPDMDGYALYFDQKVYYYTKTGAVAMEADCAWAYNQVIQANSGYPQIDLTGFEVLNEGRRFVVTLMMAQNVTLNPDSDGSNFPEPRTGQFSCEVIRINERPEGYGQVLSYDLESNVTSFAAKPRYRTGEAAFALTETAFAGKPLTVTGSSVSLAELEAKYAVGRPLADFKQNGNAVKGTVSALTKRYKLVRVPRQEYRNSLYFSSAVQLKTFTDYFTGTPLGPVQGEPPPPPPPSGRPLFDLEDMLSAVSAGGPSLRPVGGVSAAPTDGSSTAPETAPTPAPTPTEVPAPPKKIDSINNEYIVVSGDSSSGSGRLTRGSGVFSPLYPGASCFLLDSASTGQSNYRFERIVYWERRDEKFWYESAETEEVLIPNSAEILLESGASLGYAADYAGWLRTVFAGSAYGLAYTLQPYEDVKILEGYDIEISQNSYVLDFQVTPNTSVSEKPLYGGSTLFQTGNVFTAKNLISGANVAGTAVTVADAKDFGWLRFAGTPALVGYVVLTEPTSGANGLRIRTLGSSGQTGQANILYPDIHFISSEERERTGQTEPSYMQRYDPLPTPDPRLPTPTPIPTPTPGADDVTTDPRYGVEEITGDDTYNSDRYSPASVLALSASDFIITSMQNGVVRCSVSGGRVSANQILEAPLYRSWRLANGNFMAVGFELRNPSKRYDMTDFAKGKVLIYSLDGTILNLPPPTPTPSPTSR
ncbi:MAG: hypothetical protein LBL26_07105, partial [Peptococcaceae bacterium]|nr:hypothetical protein [Peptococcaceae bacterium]